MNKFILNESPKVYQTSIACVIGLNEALFLQQVKYLISISKNVKEGQSWTYQTLKEWRVHFPFWSESTIKRTIKNLERQGFLISTNKYNRCSIDKTKWYRLDENKIVAYINLKIDQNDLTSGQNDLTSGQNETSQIDPSTGHADPSTGHADPSTGHADPSTGQIDHTNNHRIHSKITSEITSKNNTFVLSHESSLAREKKKEKPDDFVLDGNTGLDKKKEKPPKRTNYSEGFNRFWYAYTHPPAGCTARNAGKAAAFAYWKRDRLESITDELVEKVMDFWGRDDSWRSGYQPFAQKWLNQKRYDDEPQGEIVNLTVEERSRKRRIDEIRESAEAQGEDVGSSSYGEGSVFAGLYSEKDNSVIEGECYESK